MRNLLNPRWLLVVNTLPLVLLFFLFFYQFNIIKTLLEAESIELWKTFGTALAGLGILNLAFTVYLILKKKSTPGFYAVVALLCYIPFIYLYGYHIDQIMPFSIPRWMVSGNIALYVGTFLMPTLVYSLFVLVAHLTPKNKEHSALVSFLCAFGIPALGYVFVQVILPLWQVLDSQFDEHAFLILLIVATVLFLFFLIRSVFILASKKAASYQQYQLAWKIPIAVVFPILGLLLNNGYLIDGFGPQNSGVFGDFNNAWFYILAVINGVLVCLPNLENTTYRISLFIGRSVTFAYTLYFFLVFLPFLPLSVIAIIAFGSGFLMLTPLLLFIIHVNELSKDFSHLKTFFTKNVLVAASFLGFFVIPGFITTSYLADKEVLHETLSYLYSPDYSKQYDIDLASLEQTLNVIRDHKSNRGGDFSQGTPYLSSYFNWLVMDNLTLSGSKIDKIEKIFFGKTSFFSRSINNQNDHVEISEISTKSNYDNSQNVWKSWIDLEITNHSGRRFAEYATTIDLPEGCWISDYYLYVGDRKEPGILAEKKSAMWIYAQIFNENKDPGILYYLTGNKVAFRVFPFSQDEVRKTGIELLHKEPIKLNIDSHVIELGNEEETVYERIETENVDYISAEEKQSLPSVNRQPYFHFLVDVSKDKAQYSTDFITRMHQLLDSHPSLAKNAKVSFVNSYVKSMALEDDWQETYRSQAFEGGFYLDRAIKTTLADAYENESRSYPVLVVVTDNIRNAVVENDFSGLEFTFPESNLFYNLIEGGLLKEHSLIKSPLIELPEVKRECQFCERVLEYKLANNSFAYLPANNEGSVILKNHVFDIAEADIKNKNWKAGLLMQGQFMSQELHPEISDKKWLSMVKYSFMSKIMTPVTSYLVVENEAQKAMLKKKQDQVLSGHKSLDAGDDVDRMSEPGFFILLILFLLILWFRRRGGIRSLA